VRPNPFHSKRMRFPWDRNNRQLGEKIINLPLQRHSMLQLIHCAPLHAVPHVYTQHWLKIQHSIHLTERFQSPVVVWSLSFFFSRSHRTENGPHTWGWVFYRTEVVVPVNDDDPRECRGCDGSKHACEESWFLARNT